MTLADMSKVAEATIAANHEAAQAEAERTARQESPEVQALNYEAQVAIYGESGDYADLETGAVGESGVLAEIASNPRYGKTEAEREEQAEYYKYELDRLLEDGYELTQAEFLMEMWMEDNTKKSTLIASKIAEGMSAQRATNFANKVYEAKDLKRQDIVKDNQLFTREEYEAFISEAAGLKNDEAAKKRKEQAREAKEKAAAAEQARKDAAAAAEKTEAVADDDAEVPVMGEADAADDEPAPAVEPTEPTPADAEASASAVEPEAEPTPEPAVETDVAAENAVLDALKEVATGEQPGKDVAEMFKKAKALIEADPSSARNVVDAFLEAAAEGIDFLIEDQVEKDTFEHGQRPTEEAIANNRAQFADSLVKGIAGDIDLDAEPAPEADEPAEVEEVADDTDSVAAPAETTDEPVAVEPEPVADDEAAASEAVAEAIAEADEPAEVEVVEEAEAVADEPAAPEAPAPKRKSLKDRLKGMASSAMDTLTGEEPSGESAAPKAKPATAPNKFSGRGKKAAQAAAALTSEQIAENEKEKEQKGTS